MGWDAFAMRNGRDLKHTPVAEGWHLADLELRAAFEEAALRARKADGDVDGLLHLGGLDCSACAKALGAATGRDAWSGRPWPSVDVQELARRAAWPKKLDWASASAKEFLETCARLGLGVRFSW